MYVRGYRGPLIDAHLTAGDAQHVERDRERGGRGGLDPRRQAGVRRQRRGDRLKPARPQLLLKPLQPSGPADRDG